MTLSHYTTLKNTTCGYVCHENTTSAFPEKDTLTWTYIIAAFVMSILSIIGSLVIIISILKISELRTPGRKLLIYLSLSDLCLVLGNIAGIGWTLVLTDGEPINDPCPLPKWSNHGTSKWICAIQAAITSTASLCSFFWTSFIALNCFLTTVKQNNILTTKLKLLPHIISWGIPLVILLWTGAYHRYGLNLCTEIFWWCWVRRFSTDNTAWKLIKWQLATGKFWEISAYIFVSVMYGLVVKRVNAYVNRVESRSVAEQSSDPQQRLLLRRNTQTYRYANLKLVFVPLVFILTRIWGTIRFILDLIPNSTVKRIAAWLAPFQGFGDSAQGFANCLVFVLTTPSLREKLPCRRLKVILTGSRSVVTPKEKESTSSSAQETAAQPQQNNTTHYGTTVVVGGKTDVPESNL